MRTRRRFVPQVDSLLCRIAPDAGASGALVDPATTVAVTDPSCDDLAVYGDDGSSTDGQGAMDPQLPNDTDDTTAIPVLPVNPLG